LLDKYRDENFYISHAGNEVAKERGMSINQSSSDSVLTRLNNASVELMGDDSNSIFKAKSAKYWDSKKHKFVTPTVGADNKKLIKTESGIRIPASYQSNRFEEWQKKTKIRLPLAGQSELGNARDFVHKGRHFRHRGSEKAPEEEDQEFQKARRVGNVKNAKHEIQKAEQIQKKRKIEARKKEKNARQSSRKKIRR
jgi:ATP-dependent RNA helicase DDX54/DBP10